MYENVLVSAIIVKHVIFNQYQFKPHNLHQINHVKMYISIHFQLIPIQNIQYLSNKTCEMYFLVHFQLKTILNIQLIIK